MVWKRRDCLSRPLSEVFAKLGFTIGSRPWFFFVVPLLVTAVLGGGFFFLKERQDNNLEQQFTPSKGPSKAERAFVKENFPYNDSMFSMERLYSRGYFASVIALSTSGQNALTKRVFQDIVKLNDRILNIRVANQTLGYNELCAKVDEKCFSNVILELMSVNETVISYPLHSYRSSSVFLGSVLGGVEIDVNGKVKSAQAVKLLYYLKDQEDMAEALKYWLQGFKDLLSESTNYTDIEVSYYTSKSKQEEIDSHTTDGFPLFLITYACAIGFSVISCLRADNVRNKVWVAVFGVLSAGLAVLSSFGLLLYFGVPFVITVANSPFLILGIGLNNMFILVSDWEHTSLMDPVPKRLAHTYKEAVMAVTITGLTDVLKFSIGIKSEFPSMQSFCLYTCASIIFCYIYTITFFGAFLALNGRREASNRHWLTCMKIPSDSSDHYSELYNICCVGGNTSSKKTAACHFFKDYYGPFLIKPLIKGAVIFIYVVYLTISIYGCFHVQQGIELRDLAADNSHVTRFNMKDRQYFSAYGPSVMVIVKDTFPYWDVSMRLQLQDCVEEFKSSQFVDSNVYASWLESYLEYGQENVLNLDDERVFLENLLPFFNLFPFFKQDVNISDGEIHASRIFIRTIDITHAGKEINMFNSLKSLADKCSATSLSVYNQDFIFYDQYGVVVSTTIKNVCVIAAAMLFVSLLLIGDPLCSLWVTLSIGSVTAGVMGFMTLWDVTLDSISMIIFTVCIGFTVDFSAHVSYAFVCSKKSNPDDKVVEAISHLGYPIIQGTLSTILGASVLAISEFHTFRTFFKLYFLVMSIGMVHGLVFIPIVLTLLTCSSEKDKNKEEISTVSKL